MKWNDYRCMGRAAYNLKKPKLSYADFVLMFCTQLNKSNQPGAINSSCQMAAEIMWLKDSRPYYDLYPSVTEAFLKVDLSGVTSEHIKLPLKTLMIRLAEGHEIRSPNGTEIRSIFVATTKNRESFCPALLLCVDEGKMHKGLPVHSINGVTLIPGESIEQRLIYSRDHGYHIDGDNPDSTAFELAMRIVVTLCLLQGNPDLIEPLPLEADISKWEFATPDERTKLLDKAKRRGKVGWAIGKHIETAPGFRRPHFAIRWMGHGEPKTPTLRPIKGCIVNRHKISDVPTGYLDDQIEEAINV